MLPVWIDQKPPQTIQQVGHNEVGMMWGRQNPALECMKGSNDMERIRLRPVLMVSESLRYLKSWSMRTFSCLRMKVAVVARTASEDDL